MKDLRKSHVRMVERGQNFHTTSSKFNVFVKKHSQFTHEGHDLFIITASRCESTQLPYSIFYGGGHLH